MSLSDEKYAILCLVSEQSKHSERSQFFPQLVGLAYFVAQKEPLIDIEFSKNKYESFNSDDVTQILFDLADSGYITVEEHLTYGGDLRYEAEITSKGEKTVNSKQNLSLHTLSQAASDEYGEIPVSNMHAILNEKSFTD